MNFLLKDGERMIFHVGPWEKDALLKLIQSYPRLTSPRGAISMGMSAKELTEKQELFEESLKEQRTRNREQVEAMLKDPGRFVENDVGYQFALKAGELEWLLQVLNDIRVGNWLKLGSPNPLNEIAAPLTEENIRCLWEMDLAAAFEMALLQPSAM